MFDEPQLFTLLLQRFSSNSTFKLALYVDEKTYKEKTAKYQQKRLTDLKKAGAQVFLCHGRTPQGVWHKKAAIIDRRYKFAGGLNFTFAARAHNEESLLFLVGPGVSKTLASLWDARARATPL